MLYILARVCLEHNKLLGKLIDYNSFSFCFSLNYLFKLWDTHVFNKYPCTLQRSFYRINQSISTDHRFQAHTVSTSSHVANFSFSVCNIHSYLIYIFILSFFSHLFCFCIVKSVDKLIHKTALFRFCGAVNRFVWCWPKREIAWTWISNLEALAVPPNWKCYKSRKQKQLTTTSANSNSNVQQQQQ